MHFLQTLTLINIIINCYYNPEKRKVSFHRMRIKTNQNQKFISKIDEEEPSKMSCLENKIEIILWKVIFYTYKINIKKLK